MPNPSVQGGYVSIQNDMPAPSVLSPVDQFVDEAFAGNPNLQRQAYDWNSLPDKYPVRPVMPVQTMPLENQIAFDQAKTRMQSENLELQKQQFQNTAMQSNFNYQQKVLQQSQQAFQDPNQGIGALNPASPDYPAQRAKFIQQFPLGNQNSFVAHSLGQLDQTYQGLQHNNQVLQNQNLNQARSLVSHDPALLNEFEQNHMTGNMGDPMAFASRQLSDKTQQSAQNALNYMGVKDATPYRLDPNDPQSPLDINAINNQLKVHQAGQIKQAQEDAYVNRPVTRRDYGSTISQINSLVDKVGNAGTPSEAQKLLMNQLVDDANQYLTRDGGKAMANPFESNAAKESQYQQGRVYGGMKYNGGDPNDAANWQKIR